MKPKSKAKEKLIFGAIAIAGVVMLFNSLDTYKGYADKAKQQASQHSQQTNK